MTTEDKAREYAKNICKKNCRSMCEVSGICTIFNERIKNYLAGHSSRNDEVKELREVINEFIEIEERIFGLSEIKSHVPEKEVLDLIDKAKQLLQEPYECYCGAESFKECICFDSKQIGYKD